ncbi:MAG: hypothetical protein HYU64_13565 [Armatimonadetes bacterium]|nr:hypothetical protein [Armatimonadota bacterium]
MCARMSPELAQFERDYAGKFRIVRVNVDNEQAWQQYSSYAMKAVAKPGGGFSLAALVLVEGNDRILKGGDALSLDKRQLIAWLGGFMK